MTQPNTPKKTSIADAYLETFRQKRAATRPTEKPATKVKRNWFAIIFLTFWLTGWSIAVCAVFAVLLFGGQGGFIFVFLCVWLTIALVAWYFAVRTIRKEWRGTPIEKTGSNP